MTAKGQTENMDKLIDLVTGYFMEGASVVDLAAHYQLSTWQVENLIRTTLKTEKDRQS